MYKHVGRSFSGQILKCLFMIFSQKIGVLTSHTGKQKEKYYEFFSSAELGQRAVKIFLFCFVLQML